MTESDKCSTKLEKKRTRGENIFLKGKKGKIKILKKVSRQYHRKFRLKKNGKN